MMLFFREHTEHTEETTKVLRQKEPSLGERQLPCTFASISHRSFLGHKNFDRSLTECFIKLSVFFYTNISIMSLFKLW